MNNRRVFSNADSLYEAAANYIIELSTNIISIKGRFIIALSGGNTPRKLYELLAQAPFARLADWKNIFIFWSDERCVPSTDKYNNSHMAFGALLDHVPIPAKNIFPVPVNLDPVNAATAYEQTLQLFFKDPVPVFDLILLGLGDNGHTASLFPFTSILKEKEHLVKEVFVTELNAYRISFTTVLINNAAEILFLVTGKEKAPVINTISSGEIDPDKYPVQLIAPEKGNVHWFLDEPAASTLNKN